MKCCAFGNTSFVKGAICAFLEPPAVAVLIVHRLTTIPFSFTAHGHDIHKDRTMLWEKISAAAFAVTVSGYNTSLMTKECPSGDDNKIDVIHCGVDTRLFKVPEKLD